MTNTNPPVEYCYNHANRETVLHCNRCGKPMCPACMVLTPTGYRCKDCVSGHLKAFDTARKSDYVIAFVVAGILGFVGSFTAAMGFFVIFLAPVAGVIIAETVRWLVRRRRSKLLSQVTAAAAALGSLPPFIIYFIGLLALPAAGMAGEGILASVLWNIIWQAAYTFLVTSTIYYRLHGIRISG